MKILLENGYWAVAIVVLFSILSVAVFLEKLIWYLYYEIKNFSKNVQLFVEDDENTNFLTNVNQIDFTYNSTVRLAKELIKEYKDICVCDVIYLEEKLKEIVFKKIKKSEEKLWILKITAVLSPMIGLLGTVIGMMTAFDNISRLGTSDTKVVASGINGALLTTAAGLIAAIPAMFFYNYLIEKNDILIGDMKKVGLEIINDFRKRKIKDERLIRK